jgi:FixJ family two-component response regulator
MRAVSRALQSAVARPGFLDCQTSAAEIGIPEATVKLHRGNIMRKMAARSLVDLVRMVDLLAMLG